MISSLLTGYQDDDGLLLLVAILSQALLALVGSHLVFLSLLTAWHSQSCFGPSPPSEGQRVKKLV